MPTGSFLIAHGVIDGQDTNYYSVYPKLPSVAKAPLEGSIDALNQGAAVRPSNYYVCATVELQVGLTDF